MFQVYSFVREEFCLNRIMLAVFNLYGTGHMWVLISIIATAALIILFCKKNEHSPQAKACISLLTFCCFAAYPINLLAWESVGGAAELDAVFPFHLCDIAAFLCGFALITRRPLLCELSYFWGLAGTMQGLLTPNLAYNFPHPVFFAFFLQHGVIVITAIVLPLGLGWRPRSGAVKRVFGWVIIYAVAAFLVNFFLDTNYGFLMRKPNEASLLDVMPAWPGYVFCVTGLAGVFFFALNLPFKCSQKK